MKISAQLLIAFLLLCFPGHASEQSLSLYPIADDTLQVGDIAPPLRIIKWIKGNPVTAFKKDSLYVIEFGFAACTACRASIPHLTELAKKYKGKVHFIGVHIWENNPDKPSDLTYITKVEHFVNPIWNKIGYTIAVDVPQQTTANSWGGGAPKTFLVGTGGKILWIGYPTEVGQVIEQVVGGVFDPAATATKQKLDKAASDTAMLRIWKLKESKEYTKAIAVMDSLIGQQPANSWLYYFKYRLLDGIDQGNKQANALVVWLLKTKPPEFKMMYYLAGNIIESKYPDYDLAIAVADWGYKESIYNYSSAWILDCKAGAYYKKGDLRKAIEVQKTAISLINPDSTQMKDALTTLQNKLNTYQKEWAAKQAN